MAEAKFYTYIHRKADTGEVFYVGKGTGKRVGSCKDRNKHWRQIVEKHGFIFEKVASFFDESASFAHEIFLIAEYRKAGTALANYTDGGQGQSGRTPSPESRRKLSEALTGRKWTASQRRACEHAIAMRGPISKETRAKISKALKGEIRGPAGPRPAAVKAKIAASLKGRAPREDVLEKSAAARRGVPLSDAVKKKISLSKKGVPLPKFSDEHRAKMSASRIAYFARKRLDQQPQG